VDEDMLREEENNDDRQIAINNKYLSCASLTGELLQSST
jgi:hypothetical protein